MGFVMECYENGILNEERTGGLRLNFGNADHAMELLHQLARGEGFGKRPIHRLDALALRMMVADLTRQQQHETGDQRPRQQPQGPFAAAHQRLNSLR